MVMSIKKFDVMYNEKLKLLMNISALEKSVIPILTVNDKESNIGNILKIYLTNNSVETVFNKKDMSVDFEFYSNGRKVKSNIVFLTEKEFDECKEYFDKIIKSKNQTQYYASYRIRYVGGVDDVNTSDYYDDKYNGYGILFYDNLKNSKKYQGNFNNGIFDGDGTFFDYKSNLLVKLSSTNGVPNRKSYIYYKYNRKTYYLEVDFCKLWIDLNFDALAIMKYVDNNDFVSNLFKHVLKFNNYKEHEIKEIMFENLTPEEKDKALDKKSEEVQMSIKKLEKLKVDTKFATNLLVASLGINFLFLTISLSMYKDKI